MQSGVTDITTAKNIARKLFLSYANGSQIEKQSLEKMLSDTYKIMNKDFHPTTQDVNLYGNILDFNGDGKISIQDFQALAIKFLVRPETKNYTKNVKERIQVAKRLFEKFDSDKDGFLSEKQIPDLLIETYRMMGMNFNPTQQDIDSWMQMTDLDGDGKVNLEDYQRLIISSLQRCGIRIYQRD